MAKANNAGKISSVNIRMYRGGTGDFFILRFKTGDAVSFQMMIDCGCIQAGKDHFVERVEDLKTLAGDTIDLLVVTHEHADHINGFEKAAELFKDINFKKVWFAWTEDDSDPVANDYRKNASELDMAIKMAVGKLSGLSANQYYEKLYEQEENGAGMAIGKNHFISSLASIDSLNISSGLAAKKGKVKPTMAELLRQFNVIKGDTVVAFLEPGDVKSISAAKGLKFYVLGPPKKAEYLDREHSEDGNYEKRVKKSTVDFAFISALGAAPANGSATSQLPFDAEYEEIQVGNVIPNPKVIYDQAPWRNIDHEWLYSAGGLAMRYESSINNTSLALAIQFEDSERVLLFPGDAELGNWQSWHDGLSWPVKIEGKTVKKKIDYFLANTVFYKVGHHLSQNGTATKLGIDLMTGDDITVMATLDFNKINSGWLNTMPNDLLGADLLRKSQGKFYFTGDVASILKNIKTDRVTIKKSHENKMNQLNGKFDGEIFVECEVQG